MVIGGSGDFFEVADVVLQFDKYQAYCVTKQAKEIASEFACTRNAKVIAKAENDTYVEVHVYKLNFDGHLGKHESGKAKSSVWYN